MKFFSKDLGEPRWFMMGWSSGAVEDRAFCEWMDNNCEDCMYILRFNSGEPYWELRGGDQHLRTLILMRWQGTCDNT